MELEVLQYSVKLSSSDIFVLSQNHLDKILINQNTMTKGQIIEEVANLRDIIDRYN